MNPSSTTHPRWLFDRTGFPYLPVPQVGIAVGVLPITKAQAELHLADPAGPGDDWYAEVIDIGPRMGWRVPGPCVPWHLLLTGISVEEASRFAAWVGPGYRLPDLREWRAADRALSALGPAQVDQLADRIDGGDGHPAAAGIIHKLRESGRRTAAALTLVDGGVLEWVTRPYLKPGGLGRPAPDLPGNLILDPQVHEPVVRLIAGRYAAFGCRLVRPLALGA